MSSAYRQLIGVSFGLGTGIFVYKTRRSPLYYDCLKQVDCDNKHKSELTLLGVQIFFRHGARIPLNHAPGLEEVKYDRDVWLKRHEKTDIPYKIVTFDGSPRPPSHIEERYKNVTFPGGMSAGMLTTLGRDQAYALGQRIRDKYIIQHKLISDEYRVKTILTRSTNVNRSVQSLQSVIAGMYEKDKRKDILKILTLPNEKEILFPNRRMCPTLRMLEKMVHSYIQTQDGYKFVAHYIKYFTGDDTDNYLDLMNWRDHYVARKSHGLATPEWLEAVNKPLQKEAAKVIAIEACGTKDDHFMVMQLAVGPMFHLIEDTFDNIIRSVNGCPKLHLYSGHDTTLVPLLVGIGAWNDVWPPYCSDLAVELYQDRTGTHFIKAVYNGQDVVFPGFEEPIVSYNEFKAVVAPYTTTPVQYSERCHNMDLARETAEFWRAIKASKEEEEEEYPSNM